jgi:hypothetical protein
VQARQRYSGSAKPPWRGTTRHVAKRFDMQLLENPEISGVEYQRGTLVDSGSPRPEDLMAECLAQVMYRLASTWIV